MRLLEGLPTALSNEDHFNAYFNLLPVAVGGKDGTRCKECAGKTRPVCAGESQGPGHRPTLEHQQFLRDTGVHLLVH